MATVKLTLSSKVTQGDGKSEVLLRISFSRTKVFRVKSKVYVLSQYWDNAKGKLKIPRVRTQYSVEVLETQKRLDELVNYILNQCLSVDTNLLNKEKIEDMIHVFHHGESLLHASADTNSENTLYKYLNEFIEMRIKTENRARQFKSMIRMLMRFELYKGKNYKLGLDTMTDVDLMHFEEFLRIEHTFFDKLGNCIKHPNIYLDSPGLRVPKNRGTNGVRLIMKRLRTFYSWAKKTDRTKNDPFEKYKIPGCVYGKPYFMSWNEIEHLYHYDFSNRPKLAIQRDIFIFQSCVGMRTGDLYRLTKDNVLKLPTGYAVEYIANKTVDKNGNTIHVLLIKMAVEILQRYIDMEGDSLFPFISRQKYNDAIKEMLTLAKVNRIITILNPVTRKDEQYPICKKATSYMARRNFIGNLYDKVQDPNIISTMTGHVDGSRAFARYRNIDRKLQYATVKLLE